MHQFDIISSYVLLTAFAVEFIFILLHRPSANLLKDTAANFVCGLCIVATGIAEKSIAFVVFSLLYEVSFFKPTVTPVLWMIGFLSCDFIHYLYHWLGHKTRLFWAAHVTHHSSGHFNLSTGLRTNFVHLFYRFLFWAPLCLFGIPPTMILLFESISATQNFLVHTEKIKKLRVLDWWFNTPSNHRVHHGSNPEYIDKNLGGILMIYDHIFGTYAKEEAKVVYGLTHDIHTHHPAKILFQEFITTSKKLAAVKGWKRKIKYLFSAPQG